MSRALIIAHGQPSDPEPAAAALRALAAQIGAHLPGWQVDAATLAQPGALETAATGAPGLAYPLFMAEGWFTRRQIPDRLAKAGAAGWHVLPPFGLDRALHALAIALLRDQAPKAVLLAAHGSFKSPEPARIARALAARIAGELGLRCEAAFIDQPPKLSRTRGFPEGSLCLPFFAMSGGHVEEDLPQALTEARFPGRILPALGLHPDVPALIAGALRNAQALRNKVDQSA